jgi:ubiquinone/menaquinone biosynthesis C-methylase UbiE
MEQDWDSRAREAAEYYIATGQKQWHQDDFFKSGEINVANEVLSDPNIMRRGKKPARMRVLEIGCGAGRMTKALARIFGEVHAVDISAEMIRIAHRNLDGIPNVLLYKNNGSDLSELASRRFDFAFSFIVFQHIPSLPVVENYVREVHRCLRPGGLFKFQVQGATEISPVSDDTWVGVSLTLADAKSLAARSGFELIAASGEGTQYLWLWFLKPKLPRIPIGIRTQAAKAMNGVRDVLEAGYLRSKRVVSVAFSPASVRPGESYRVRIPEFPNQWIDVGYELAARDGRSTGVVGEWCELDSHGETSITAPPGHPPGVVRITKIRSRTANGGWYRAKGAIEVLPALQPR